MRRRCKHNLLVIIDTAFRYLLSQFRGRLTILLSIHLIPSPLLHTTNTKLIQHTLLRLLDTLLLHDALLIKHALLRLQHTLLFNQTLLLLNEALLLSGLLLLFLLILSAILLINYRIQTYVENLQHQKSEADAKGQTNEEQEDACEHGMLVQIEIRLVGVLLSHQKIHRRVPRT